MGDLVQAPFPAFFGEWFSLSSSQRLGSRDKDYLSSCPFLLQLGAIYLGSETCVPSSWIFNSGLAVFITHLLQFLTIFPSLFFPSYSLNSFQGGCQAISRGENNESNSSSEQTLLEYLNEINDAGENTGSLTYWRAECHVGLSLRRMIPSCRPAVLPSWHPGTLPWTCSPCRSWASKPISIASGQNQLKSRYSLVE